VYHSGLIMKPIFTQAKESPRRIVFAEAEDERVLRAVQVVIDERIAVPVLIGRPAVVERRVKRAGLRLKVGSGCVELVNPEDDPPPEQLLEMTFLAAEEIRRFGLVPKVALVSHSSFGTSDAPSAAKMRRALQLIRDAMPDLDVEGEMHGDAAMSEEVRKVAFP